MGLSRAWAADFAMHAEDPLHYTNGLAILRPLPAKFADLQCTSGSGASCPFGIFPSSDSLSSRRFVTAFTQAKRPPNLDNLDLEDLDKQLESEDIPFSAAGPQAPPPRQSKGVPKNRTWTTRKFDNERANYSIAIQVQKLTDDDVRVGGPIIPLGDQREAFRNRTASIGPEIDKFEREAYAYRIKRMQAGKEVPAIDRLETLAQEAHDLMEAGDYGTGVPFPLNYEGPPAHHKMGAELATHVRKQLIGASREATEMIHCYEGDEEVPCLTGPVDEVEDGCTGPHGAEGLALLAASRSAAFSSVAACVGQATARTVAEVGHREGLVRTGREPRCARAQRGGSLRAQGFL